MGRRANEGRNAARERLAANPFYVLGLRPDCARAEIEREGQKLLGMLELELTAAKHYRSPIGVHPRSAAQIREAMAELRDPDRRLLHELWAALDPELAPQPDQESAEPLGDAEPGGDAHSGAHSSNHSTGHSTSPSTNTDADLSPFPALATLGFGPRGSF
ncbi:MAG: hypothetical protein KC457_12210 [Myxococcales bacterium]|nr:hypothetical protein [Myxococcales bacterium]